mmetsp:Transcript_30773/g.100161  ORF Transcript_30773/g.100161 Transcript_30773/m.100161 type:complete len:210 (+) Transcript_30773:206-835(+)
MERSRLRSRSRTPFGYSTSSTSRVLAASPPSGRYSGTARRTRNCIVRLWRRASDSETRAASARRSLLPQRRPASLPPTFRSWHSGRQRAAQQPRRLLGRRSQGCGSSSCKRWTPEKMMCLRPQCLLLPPPQQFRRSPLPPWPPPLPLPLLLLTVICGGCVSAAWRWLRSRAPRGSPSRKVFVAFYFLSQLGMRRRAWSFSSCLATAHSS